jgi:hypothetical protein
VCVSLQASFRVLRGRSRQSTGAATTRRCSMAARTEALAEIDHLGRGKRAILLQSPDNLVVPLPSGGEVKRSGEVARGNQCRRSWRTRSRVQLTALRCGCCTSPLAP